METLEYFVTRQQLRDIESKTKDSYKDAEPRSKYTVAIMIKNQGLWRPSSNLCLNGYYCLSDITRVYGYKQIFVVYTHIKEQTMVGKTPVRLYIDEEERRKSKEV